MNLDRLKRLLSYKEDKLYWRRNKDVPHTVRGKLAGSTEPCGYTRIKLDGKKYRQHRLVYLYHKGYLPEFVDHKDGDPTNDRIDNLRECSRAQNMQNCKLRKDNKSGTTGVCYHPSSGKWRVTVTANKRVHYLGRFEDKELAELIASEAREFYHGEFAR